MGKSLNAETPLPPRPSGLRQKGPPPLPSAAPARSAPRYANSLNLRELRAWSSLAPTSLLT